VSYPKGDLTKLDTPHARVNALVQTEASARSMLEHHVPRPDWVTDSLLAPKAAAASAMKQAAETYDPEGSITLTDEAYRSVLWHDYIVARAGMWPLVNILQGQQDEFYEMATKYDFPTRLGALQAVHDLAKAYGDRQSESTFFKLACVTSPVSCWLYRKARGALSGTGPASSAIVVRQAPHALGAVPGVVVAGAVVVLIGVAIVAAFTYSSVARKELEKFNERYMARCSPDVPRTPADIEWCNSTGGSPGTLTTALGSTAAIIGVTAVVGYLGYRLLVRQLDRADARALA